MILVCSKSLGSIFTATPPKRQAVPPDSSYLCHRKGDGQAQRLPNLVPLSSLVLHNVASWTPSEGSSTCSSHRPLISFPARPPPLRPHSRQPSAAVPLTDQAVVGTLFAFQTVQIHISSKMNLPGHTTPRGPHLLNTRESGTHAQGTAGHSGASFVFL